MHGVQHKRMGVAAGIGVLAFTLLSNAPPELAIVTVTAPMGAMFPDIDHDRSKLGQTRKKITTLAKVCIELGIAAYLFISYTSGGMKALILNALYVGGGALLIFMVERNKVVRKQLGFITKHRGIMHTLVPPLAMMGTTFWTNSSYYLYAMVGLALGDVIHLLGDMGTEEGSPILWPLVKSNIRYSKFNTTRNGTAIEVLCNIWCVALVSIGVYLGMKGGF